MRESQFEDELTSAAVAGSKDRETPADITVPVWSWVQLGVCGACRLK